MAYKHGFLAPESHGGNREDGAREKLKVSLWFYLFALLVVLKNNADSLYRWGQVGVGADN